MNTIATPIAAALVALSLVGSAGAAEGVYSGKRWEKATPASDEG